MPGGTASDSKAFAIAGGTSTMRLGAGFAEGAWCAAHESSLLMSNVKKLPVRILSTLHGLPPVCCCQAH